MKHPTKFIAIKKILGFILIILGIAIIFITPNFGRDFSGTFAVLLVTSILTFIPAFFLLRNRRNKSKKENPSSLEIIYCSNCGTSNSSLDNYCSKCGNKLSIAFNQEKSNIEVFPKSDTIVPEIKEANEKSKTNELNPPKMTEEEKKRARNGCLIFLVIGFVVACFIFNKSDDNSAIKTDGILDDSELLNNVQDYLKTNYLKDPDSYQWIESNKTVYPGDVPNKYLIDLKYRAKNGFGGYTIEEKIFTLDKNGKVILMQDVQ